MDQDLQPPPGESPYDNAGDAAAVGRNTEEHAYDNATYEMDTGEQTTVDMQTPEEPVNDIPNDPEPDVVADPGNDLDIDAEGEVVVDEEMEPSAVIEVNAVDGDADVDPKDEIEMVRLNDGEELPEYTEPEDEEAGPLPSKSRGDSRIYESIKRTPAGPSAGPDSEEEKLRQQKSLKICIFLFIIVLIGVIIGLVAFYIVYSVGLAAATLPSTTTPGIINMCFYR
ncbi:uncharacterized protein LOC105440503 [Strongylocentrotus purpuratus]|uniref:Uncharacterized protein n=1 Tax=Strongylocentrotus purpuratus TaxID=7668 RepID=A0A7M7N9U1_STRPU|nr:uncharacterized protein LOC105440503 [Strongylocentrotus purpuratus]